MMDKTALASATGRQHPQDLMRVFDAARRFVEFRHKVATANAGRLSAPATLAEAIDRDFLEFDLESAAHDLREAVLAVDPILAILPRATTAAGATSGVRQDN